METNITTLDKNLALLSNFKQQADEVGDLCLQITITDETTLAIGQQNLAKANQLSKAIEDKRKAIKQPYLDAGKKVDEVAKTLSESIEKGIKHIKDQVADWEKKRREEEAKKKQILDYINGELSSRLQQLYNEADTLDKAAEALKYITERFPKDDKFGDYVSVAHALRDNYKTMLEAKIQAFNTGDIRAVTTAEMLVEDAKGSGKVSETLTKEGDQNVRREKTVFDEQLFRDSVALKLKDPAFRKQMIDQGLMKEDGTYTEEFDKAISVYKRKGEGEKIKQYKNAPKATTSGRSGGSNGMANIKSAFDEEGLEFIKVGGVDLSKKVNYRVIKSSSSGKYYLRVGSTSDNDIPLKEGVNFRRKGASNQGQVGPEPYTPPPAKKETTKSKSGKTEPPKKKKVTAADL